VNQRIFLTDATSLLVAFAIFNGLCNFLVTLASKEMKPKSISYQNKEDFMKSNMGTTDRIIRAVIVAFFAYLYFGGIVTGTLGIVLLVLGVVFLATSVLSFCPLYLPFRFSTRK
jgi:hypothetical protein